jgi:hypothetical protein
MFSVSEDAVIIFVTMVSLNTVLSSFTETTASLCDSLSIEALIFTFGILNVSFRSLSFWLFSKKQFTKIFNSSCFVEVNVYSPAVCPTGGHGHCPTGRTVLTYDIFDSLHNPIAQKSIVISCLALG